MPSLSIQAAGSAKATPNGYEIVMGQADNLAVGPLLTKVTYNPVKDLRPVAHVADQPIILTGRDSSVREQVDGLFDQTRLTMNAGMEANYMSTVLALVRQGLGISVLPESAADSLEGLKRINIDHPGVNREIGLISRSGIGLSPAAQRCFDMLNEALPDTPQR